MTLGDRDFRILGRVVTKSGINSIFPKFRIVSEEPFAYETYYSVNDILPLEDSALIFEPTKDGLGITREIMYVATSSRTYLFSVDAVGDITWGDETITFNYGVNFNAQVI